MARKTIAERFWEKVEVRGVRDCWLWTASRGTVGYGQIGLGKAPIGAHRLCWILSYGPIPKGLCVLHDCDVRACCNPTHLFLGTQTDNMADMDRKKRRRIAVGEAAGKAKLTTSRVIAIRASAESNRALAKKYGVTKTAISNIRTRTTWKHLP